jgi:predicted nucleic acid-binding protein
MIWNTNSIIFFLRDLLPESSKFFLIQELKRSKPHFSKISEIELLSWKLLPDKELSVISSFLSHFERIELTEKVKLETIKIRRLTGIKIPDAIIAASAITLDKPLLTHNLKDFNKVEKLEIINPMEIISK